MEFVEVQQKLKELSESLREHSIQYANIRKKFGNAKHNLFILLAPEQTKKEYRKAALEKQLIMLLADTLANHQPEVKGHYKNYIKLEQSYKGLGKVIEAEAESIRAIQSLIRWQREND